MRPILAAGAVVTRQHPARGTEVVVIHRQKYSDWTLPKGKVESGESVPATAVREVCEETGVSIRLGAPLDTVEYDTGNGPKEVRFWAGTMLESTTRAPDEEVDVVAWLPVKAALSRLTYSQDQILVKQHAEQPPTTALVILRHAKAMARSDWSRADAARPISSRGRRQADRLVPMLGAYGVSGVVSSSSVRCVATVRPYAAARGIAVEEHGVLSEEQGLLDPAGVTALVARIRKVALADDRPTVLCCHRPVLPIILDALELAPTSLSTGEMLVAHLTGDGAVHAIEHHRPQR